MPIISGGGGGGGGTLTKTVTIGNAAILTLPTTPVKILDPVGAGLAPVPWALFAHLDPSAGAYTNCDPTAILRVGTATSAATWVLVFAENTSDDFPLFATGNTSPLFGTFGLQAGLGGGGGINDHGWNNAPLYCDVNNAAAGNFTGGNAANTLKLTVLYAVVAV